MSTKKAETYVAQEAMALEPIQAQTAPLEPVREMSVLDRVMDAAMRSDLDPQRLGGYLC